MKIRRNYLPFAAIVCVVISVASIIASQSGCTSAPVGPTNEIVMPSPSPSVLSPYVTTGTTSPTLSLDDLVGKSACAAYHWKDRGKAPIGYLKGVARVFAQEVCRNKPQRTLGNFDHDALVAYKKDATLLNTYTLLLGLGMRESSGKYYEGRDASAGPEKPEETEAGLFQASWNSHAADPELSQLYHAYLDNQSACMLSTFKEGVTDRTTTNYGTGDAAAFQKLSKDCPAFATRYTALSVRVLKRHFGPLRTQKAEFREECRGMLEQIQKGTYCPL